MEAQASQRKVEAETQAREEAGLWRHRDDWLWCCSGCVGIGLARVGLGLVATAGLRRAKG